MSEEEVAGSAGAQSAGSQTEPTVVPEDRLGAERAELERALRAGGVDPQDLEAAAQRRGEPEHFTLGLLKAYGALREEDLRALLGEERWGAAQGLFESGRLIKRTYPDASDPRARWVQTLGAEEPGRARLEQIVAAIAPGRAYLGLVPPAGAAAPASSGAPAARGRWLVVALAGLTALGLIAGALFLASTQGWPDAQTAGVPPTATSGAAVPSPSTSVETPVVLTPEPTLAGPTPTLVAGEECGHAVVAGLDGDVLTLRVNPTTSAGIIARMAEGTELTVLCEEPRSAEGRTWYRVQTRSKKQGWVSGAYLERR